MKKLLLVLIALIMFGCSSEDNTVKVSDPDAAIVQVDSETVYTKQDLFNTLKGQSYGSLITANLNMQIATAEGISDEELEEAITEQVAMYQALYGDYYEQLLSAYGGEDGFKEMLKKSYAGSLLVEKYIDENMDSYLEEYQPFKAQMAYFEDEESAQSLIDRVNEGEDFATVAYELGYTLSASETVYTDKDSLSLEVKTYVNENDATGLSEVIPSSVSTTDSSGNTTTEQRYYVLNIISRDVEEFKDDFITALESYIDSSDIYAYYYNKYEVTFYDQDSYDLLADTYSGIK